MIQKKTKRKSSEHTRLKTNRKRMRKIIIAIFVVAVIYYGYILYSTQNVMEEIYKVTQEEKTVEDNSPLRMFYMEKEYYIDNIVRYYTWCWRGQGKIYLTYEYEILNVGRVRDWCVIRIEKKDGKWEAVEMIWSP